MLHLAELRYLKLAHKLNGLYQDKLLQNKLHFRGNTKSISLISLAKETPDIGKSGILTEKTAKKYLDAICSGDYHLEKKRDTREKELQAWLIYNALTNNHKLFFDPSLSFLTSELSISDTVNDILAIDDIGNLVVIELKSARNKKRLEQQIEAFMAIIETNKSFFSELVELLSGRRWTGETRGMVVWPASTQRIRKIKPGIREICYKEKVVDGKRLINYDSEGNIQFVEMR
jgi:hypothetical protein